MPVNVRWVTLHGQQLIRVRVPGQPAVYLSESNAIELIPALGAAVMKAPPTEPDNDDRGHR